jgi:hypothetical protein
MPEDKEMNEQDSLRIITEMIQKARSDFHESGSSAILWGTVIGICGLVSFAELQFNFSIGFSIWLLTFAAIIPQIIIGIREGKNKVVKTHQQSATNIVWMVYIFSISAVILYWNISPPVADRLIAEDGVTLWLRDNASGHVRPWHMIVPSGTSLLLIVYAFPTLATGLINKFPAMIWGAIICYALFLLSLFTSSKWDMLLNGIAGICNWLIPGLMLRARYLKSKVVNV